MPDRSRILALLTVGLTLAVASGVGFVPVGEQRADRVHDPEQMVTDMLTESPDSVEGELYEVVSQNDSVLDRAVHNVTVRPPSGKKRIESRHPGENNLTLVQNETTAWLYNHSNNEVHRHDLGQAENATGWTIPALRYGHYSDLLETFDVTYEGTEQVAGREAHVVVFTDPSGQQGTASIDLTVGDTEYQLAAATLEKPVIVSEHRLWIDTAHDYPLKRQTTVVGQNNASIVRTLRYDWIDFEPDESEDTFQFEPPDSGAKHSTLEIDTREYSSVRGAQSAVPYPVPEPTVPDAYELQTVHVSRFDGSVRIHLRYNDGSNNLSVSVFPAVTDVRGLTVTIGDREGTLSRGQGRTNLYWECADRTYSVHADSETLATERQFRVAESIECD